jgi:predicted transcriptional regulator
MSTTSLKLSEELKNRATSAARELGISTHAFMLSAIDQAVQIADERASFLANAKRARDDAIETGMAFDAADVHSH